MKKKIILALTLVLMLSLMLVVSVNAEVTTYDDAPERNNIQIKVDEIIEFKDGFKCPSAYVFNDVKSIGDSGSFEGVMNFEYINGKTQKGYTYADVKGFDIPTGFTSIGKYAGSDDKAPTWITFPNTITYLANAIFQGATALEECILKFDENHPMKNFPAYMFYGCKNLKAFSMPDCFTTIYDIAHFKNCSSMTAVYLSKNLTKWQSTGSSYPGTFDDCGKMYFVNEPFTYDNIPSKPDVYYFPVGLTSDASDTKDFTNQSTMRNCTSINKTIVFGEKVTRFTNPYFLQGAKVNIVFLGDMETVTAGNGNWYKATYYFANPADKTTDNVTINGYTESNSIFLYADGTTKHLTEKVVDIEATCTANAEKVTYCFCSAEMSKETVADSALGHEFDIANGAIDLGIVYAEGFFKSGAHGYDCARCDEVQNNTVKPIFYWVGYSAKTFGDERGFGQQYVINQKELGDYKAYVESQGDIFSYGVVAAGSSSAGQPLAIVEDVVTNKEGAQSICFDQLSYDAFFMNISGIDAGSLDVALMCCAYVRVGDEIVYIDNNQTVDTVELTSFAKIDAIVNPKEDIA
ncbi:MAG: leucine-rich repeat protein [Clostridia bacterium]|nr:leucine-rich repeat protein [Clostridia bacterium]